MLGSNDSTEAGYNTNIWEESRDGFVDQWCWAKFQKVNNIQVGNSGDWRIREKSGQSIFYVWIFAMASYLIILMYVPLYLFQLFLIKSLLNHQVAVGVYWISLHVFIISYCPLHFDLKCCSFSDLRWKFSTLILSI